MKLDPKEVEAVERLRGLLNGMLIFVKENGKIRQISSMEKLVENRFQMVDKARRKR